MTKPGFALELEVEKPNGPKMAPSVSMGRSGGMAPAPTPGGGEMPMEGGGSMKCPNCGCEYDLVKREAPEMENENEMEMPA